MPGKYTICCFWVKLDKKLSSLPLGKIKLHILWLWGSRKWYYSCVFLLVFAEFTDSQEKYGSTVSQNIFAHTCVFRFQISALSNDFNDVHFRLINNLHSEDVYSFTSCINSLDAAFKWSGHTYRLWYDIMLIYGKMYSAHLCHFVIRFSAGNLI